jgi:short-subunit dehydrogenase
MTSRKTALITGASVGIGESFARLLASEKFDLVLVARDQQRLDAKADELSQMFKVNVEVISADLSKPEELEHVVARVSTKSAPIDVLINNAGFGINKSFTKSEVTEEIALLDVLVTAPLKLMHAILPEMKERNSGIIINVSSVAGWIAGGSYSAAKSYVTVLSESLHTELAGTGITVHALCPGFTRTEFHQRGKMKMGALPSFMWLNADHVVSSAWSAALKGKAISVPGWQFKILSAISRFGPRPFVRKIGMGLRKKQR